MNRYLTHDLQIECPWTLPDGILRESAKPGSDYICAKEGPVNWDPNPDGGPEQHHFTKDAHFFYWRVLGKVKLGFDGQVTFQLVPGAPHGVAPHALLGPVLAHWMLLRDRLPLHANCVAIGGELVAIVGSSGAGKSSLAAALLGAGAHPHADDVTSLQPSTALVPFGAARIKLNPDVIERLELPSHQVSPLYDGIVKKNVSFELPNNISTRPLAAIYRLQDSETHPLRISEVTRFPAVMAILSETYRPHIAVEALGMQCLLDRAASLISRVRVFDLYRKRQLSDIDGLAAEVIAHFQSIR